MKTHKRVGIFRKFSPFEILLENLSLTHITSRFFRPPYLVGTPLHEMCVYCCRLRDLQESILVSPMGVSKLMDLLSDTREAIRNEVSLVMGP